MPPIPFHIFSRRFCCKPSLILSFIIQLLTEYFTCAAACCQPYKKTFHRLRSAHARSRRPCIKCSIFLSFGAADQKDRKIELPPPDEPGGRIRRMHIFFFSVLRMRTVYNIEIPMILRIIGIFLFIWFDGLPGGTRPTGLRQQPVLRLFCCFGGVCRLPVSIFEALRPKRYYFMHNYPFFDIFVSAGTQKDRCAVFLLIGGSGGIRTHVPLRTTAFRVKW